jgi:hypothetical protein
MLNEVKHLAFSGCYEVEILRLRLRMTLGPSFIQGEERGGARAKATGGMLSQDSNEDRLRIGILGSVLCIKVTLVVCRTHRDGAIMI